MFTQRSFRIALLLSLLLHVLSVLFYRPITGMAHLIPIPRSTPLIKNPSQPIAFELVETPEDARIDEMPEDAQFLSDKNTRSQDMNQADNLQTGLPYSEGESRYKLFRGNGARPIQYQNNPTDESLRRDMQQKAADKDNDKASGQGELQIASESSHSKSRFSPQLLYGSDSKARSGSDAFSDDVMWDNREFSADDLGGVSLSTYAWDFAPYIYYMKNRLRDHIYPPPAFYQLGAISGEAILKFRLYPDGATSDLELLNYNGHKALAETSLNAVKASSPFKSLPKNFPENYLELTWTFIYSINQQK